MIQIAREIQSVGDAFVFCVLVVTCWVVAREIVGWDEERGNG